MTSQFHFAQVLLVLSKNFVISHSRDEVVVWDVVIALPSIRLKHANPVLICWLWKIVCFSHGNLTVCPLKAGQTAGEGKWSFWKQHPKICDPSSTNVDKILSEGWVSSFSHLCTFFVVLVLVLPASAWSFPPTMGAPGPSSTLSVCPRSVLDPTSRIVQSTPPKTIAGEYVLPEPGDLNPCCDSKSRSKPEILLFCNM